MNNTDGVRARGIIATIAVSALVLISAMLMFFEPPRGSRDVLLIVVGALVAFCADVKQFYFGSSSGAKVMVQNAQDVTKAAVAAVATSVPASAANALGAAGAPTGATGDPVSVKVEPEDPLLAEFRKSVLAINPDATEESIVATWKTFVKAKTQPDVTLP